MNLEEALRLMYLHAAAVVETSSLNLDRDYQDATPPEKRLLEQARTMVVRHLRDKARILGGW